MSWDGFVKHQLGLDSIDVSDTELVVGSKAMVGSNDQRPLFRRVATRVYNGMLRVATRRNTGRWSCEPTMVFDPTTNSVSLRSSRAMARA